MPKRYCYPTTAWRRLKEFERKGFFRGYKVKRRKGRGRAKAKSFE